MPRSLLSACLWAMLVVPGVASAQTDIEINAGLQLNFSQPGARSLGMGSAFIGLADDATAAYTNPAGLAHISTGEVLVEGRQWDFTATFTEGGTATVRNGALDGSGLIEGAAESSTDGESFYSFTWPFGRWVLAVYGHQLANFETGVETRGAVVGGDLGDFFVFPTRSNMLLQIEGTGLAAGVRLTDDLSVGFSVSQYTFDWDSTTRRFLSVADRERDSWWNEQLIVGDDEGLSASFGIAWQLGDRWHLGGVYRQGPEFDFSTAFVWGPASIFFDGFVADEDERVFKVPDVYGAGVAYKTANFRVILDWVHIEYSSLTAGTVSAFSDEPGPNELASRLTVDDADEIHLGLEYSKFAGTRSFTLRVGSWLDPDHEIRYEGPVENPSTIADSVLFRPGDDEIHYTAGFGVAFAKGRVELNVAADFSERVDTASASLLFRIF